MADAKISFDLVSPERLLVTTEADMVTVPATDGYMGVMAGHAPIVSTLRVGMIDVLNNGQDTRYFIRGGFVEVNEEKIIVLADEALPMEEFDLTVLDRRIKDAEEDLIAAKDDAERTRVSEALDDLRMIRAAF
jgi:F-type H+-transporting ATPase subunit epsilon